jgi:UDPglucose--hexose-1-phosphate uridylyltransferase
MFMENNELRLDALGNQAVLTPWRSKRPKDFATQRPTKTTLPSKCFFCPGNEHMTPPEIDRITRNGNWAVRCFPNKFPAFAKNFPKAYGRHEVIVELPDHYKTLSEVSLAGFGDYLEMVRRRVQDAYKDKRIKYVQVFKNEGHEAGASLEHSHTQLVAMPQVPFMVQKLAERAQKGFLKNVLRSEKKRTFYENSGFAAFCPYASRFHLESWIMAKGKARHFGELDSSQMHSLAEALKTTLSRMDLLLNFAPYNIVFYISPPKSKIPICIQILPRLAKWAGFEFGTGIIMNSMMPEVAAKALSARKY